MSGLQIAVNRHVALHQSGRIRTLTPDRKRHGKRMRFETTALDVLCAFERLFDFHASNPLIITCATLHNNRSLQTRETPFGVLGPRLVVDRR